MSSNEATLWIYDPIGDMFGPDAVTAKGVRDRLQSLRGITKLTIRINSPGGMVDDAIAIHTLLSEFPANKTVKVDGVAASAATIIVPRNARVEMAEGSKWMIHNPWTMAVGDYREMSKVASIAKKYADDTAALYAARTLQPLSVIREAMAEETWYTADEAIAAGYADAKSRDSVKVAAHTLDSLMAKARAVAAMAFPAHVGQTPHQRESTSQAMRLATISLLKVKSR